MITKQNFGKAIEDMMSPLSRVAYTVTHNTQDAEDVVQEALIKAYTKLHLFDESRGSFGGWLRAIVYFTAIDLVRKRKRIYPFDDTRNAGQLSTTYYGVLDAVRKLSKRNQTIIKCLASGLSNQEIADRLGVTYNNATVIIHRAREALRQEI